MMKKFVVFCISAWLSTASTTADAQFNPGNSSPNITTSGNTATQGAACWFPGANGYTVMCPTPSNGGSCGATGNNTGTCYVAVSNSGTTGCAAHDTQAAAIADPCNTINLAGQKVRNGASGDWLLLDRGENYIRQDFSGGDGTMSPPGNPAFCTPNKTSGAYGVSRTKPLVVTAYGTGPRPIVSNSPTGQGNAYVNNTNLSQCGGDYIAFIGIEFYNFSADPACNTGTYGAGCFLGTSSEGLDGFRMFYPFHWVLIEDCKFSFYGAPIDMLQETQAPGTIFLNRNDFTSNYVKDVFAVSFITLIELYGNIFNNILNQGDARNHLVYIDSPVISIGNIFYGDPSGEQHRAGGVVQYNIFIKSPYAHNFGLRLARPSISDHNVVINQVDSPPSSPADDPISTFTWYQGTPTEVYNAGNATISNNLVLDSLTPNSNGGAVSLSPGQTNATVSGNIACSQQAAAFIDGGAGSILSYTTPSSFGSGYTPGQYGAVPITTAHGTGALVNITVGAGGSVTSIDPPGTNSLTGGQVAGWINSITNITPTTSPFTFTATGLPQFPGVGTEPREFNVQNTGTAFDNGVFFILTSSSLGSLVTDNGSYGTNTWTSGGQTVVALGDNSNYSWWGGTKYQPGDPVTTSFGGGSGLAFNIGSVYPGNNMVGGGGYAHAADCVSHVPAFPDPGLSVGGYYASLPGSTPNQTFTGHITAGQLIIDSGSPTLNLGDGITWVGQTQDDFIKSGTSSPYTLSGANTTVAGPITMKSWTSLQFVQAAEAALSPSTFATATSACGIVAAFMNAFAVPNGNCPVTP